MRITKKMVRDARTRLDQTVKDVFQLDDEKLRLYVKNLFPNLLVENETREELLRLAILLTIPQCLPDHVTA